jgi:hypothetical protein
MANEHEIVSCSLLWCEAMTLAVLPHITLVAGHGMGTIVEIVSVHTTSSAVEIPFVVVFLILLKISLKLFLLRPNLSFRLAFRTLRAIIVGVLRGSALALSL